VHKGQKNQGPRPSQKKKSSIQHAGEEGGPRIFIFSKGGVKNLNLNSRTSGSNESIWRGVGGGGAVLGTCGKVTAADGPVGRERKTDVEAKNIIKKVAGQGARSPRRRRDPMNMVLFYFTYVIVFDVLDEIVKVFETQTAVVEFTFV